MIVTSANRATPDEFTTRVVRGKQKYFGFWRGERDEKSPIFKAYSSAIAATDEIQRVESELMKDINLTETGRINSLRDATLGFWQAKVAFTKTVAAEREKLKARVDTVFDLTDYDTATNMQHHRLIEAFTKLSGKERAFAMQPDRLRENPALAKALIAENRLTSGINGDEYERLRESLLTDEQFEELREVDLTERQIAAAEKAYLTATEVIGELAQLNDADLQLIESQVESINQPITNPDENLSLSKGGALKLIDPDNDGDDE